MTAAPTRTIDWGLVYRPGVALDLLVEETVFKRSVDYAREQAWFADPPPQDGGASWFRPRCWSSDWEAAMDMIEVICRMRGLVVCIEGPLQQGDGWWARLANYYGTYSSGRFVGSLPIASGPHALCLAALRSCGIGWGE